MFKICIIVPVYNHAQKFSNFISKLGTFPVIIVDDGNTLEQKNTLQEIAQKFTAELLSFEKNQGKGAAIIAGLKLAKAKGYTHALQIDADGQHDHTDIELFAKLAVQNPASIINGCPVYGADAPKSRTYGRKITNMWVSVETLSRDIHDAMCGFRVYPLSPMQPLISQGLVFNKMGSDIELIVKAHWAGINIINVDTKVSYPEDGISNFKMVNDNVKISFLHAFLTVGMLKNKILKWTKHAKN